MFQFDSLGRKRLAEGTLAVGIAVAVLVGASVRFADVFAGEPPSKAEQNKAPVYPSDDARQKAELDAARDTTSAERDQALAVEFVAQGRDIHSVPIGQLSTQDTGAPSLDQAIAGASLGIVRGIVVGQTLGSGFVLSTVKVSAVFGPKAVTTPTVVVRQVGGLTKNDAQTILLQVREDPILSNGSEYVLLLVPCAPFEEVKIEVVCVKGSGRQFLV